MDPFDFAERTRQAAAQVEHLTEEGVRQAAQILNQARDTLILKLASAPTEYGEWYYSQLLHETAALFADLQTRYQADLRDTLDDVGQTVAQAIDEPLRQAGLTLALPRISRQTVEALTTFPVGELIGGLTQDGKQLIQNTLQLALLGVKTPWEVQQVLAGQLDAAGPFHKIHARAEAIWQTEANRVFNTLAQARYQRLGAMFPGRFQKQWRHSGNTSHPRPNHVALDGQTIPMEDKFLVSGVECDGPHDANLPASEVIRCGCTTILVQA